MSAKGEAMTSSGVIYGDERKRTADDVSKDAVDDVKTGGVPVFREQSGGNLHPGQTASGIEVASTCIWLSCGT